MIRAPSQCPFQVGLRQRGASSDAAALSDAVGRRGFLTAPQTRRLILRSATAVRYVPNTPAIPLGRECLAVADYYTRISFYVPCNQSERGLLMKAVNATNGSWPDDGSMDILLPIFRDEVESEDLEDLLLGLGAEVDDKGIFIWNEECMNLGVIGRIVQLLAPSALPFGFTFAHTCSRPRTNAFSGGYVLVTPDDVLMGTADQSLDAALIGYALSGAREARSSELPR